MMLLIDTNILLDLVFERSNCANAKKLFSIIFEKRLGAVITASAVTDLFYIVRKSTHDLGVTYDIRGNIFKLFGVLSVTDTDVYELFHYTWQWCQKWRQWIRDICVKAQQAEQI